MVLFLQLTDEQKRWLDVLRLKGSEKKRQEETDTPANPIRRYTNVSGWSPPFLPSAPSASAHPSTFNGCSDSYRLKSVAI